MQISLIQAPYWLGNAKDPLAAGPTRIVEAGAAEALRESGHDVELVPVERDARESEDVYWTEIESSFAVMRLVAERVREAVEHESLPVVLATNCFSTVGIVAGSSADLGVERLERSRISDVPPDEIGGGLSARLDAPRQRVADIHLHLDLDVLDRSEGSVNHYATEGGPAAGDVAAAIRAIGERFRIRSAAMTAYVPSADPEGRVPPTAVRLLIGIADAAARRATAA